jgi:hypothetical protein
LSPSGSHLEPEEYNPHFTIYFSKIGFNIVGSVVLTTTVMKVKIFWDRASCSPYVNQHFRGTQCLATWYRLVSCLADFQTEVIGSSKTMVHTEATWCYILKDGNIQFQYYLRNGVFWDVTPCESCKN